jgi:signal recognition particle receptor subunit beta
VEVIVIGLAGAGKTTFIQTISHSTQWHGGESPGWLMGQLAVEDGLTVHFLEPPTMKQFDYLWIRDLIADADTSGFIVLMDSARENQFGEAVSILQTIRAYHPETPVVVAATKPDSPDAWRAEDIRVALGIPEDIPLLACNATNVEMVKETVLQLLYRIFGV